MNMFMLPFLLLHNNNCVVHADEVTLSNLALERGFSVRDVPRDGNCLFSAVAVQLDSLGIQHGETGLREQLVEHLQNHLHTWLLPLQRVHTSSCSQ